MANPENRPQIQPDQIPAIAGGDGTFDFQPAKVDDKGRVIPNEITPDKHMLMALEFVKPGFRGISRTQRRDRNGVIKF